MFLSVWPPARGKLSRIACSEEKQCVEHSMAEQGREPALGCSSASAQVVWEQNASLHTGGCGAAKGIHVCSSLNLSKLQFSQASK